jgi:crotonobetainyl-CoA:carnitine CoA-transferase CaiB-like acyl-CoA transferase
MDLLAGNRFTVASYGVAAAYAAWLLREFGAEVHHTTSLDPEALGAFLGQGATFDANPTLEPHGAPVLVTDVPVTATARADLGGLGAGCRVIWITPWGLGSDWDEAPATDLVLHAAGGWMSAVGDPGREPLGPPGAQGRFMAGLYAAIEALRPFACEGDGSVLEPGVSVVSVAEAVAATMIYDTVGFQYRGQLRERAGNRFSAIQTTLATLPVKDGYVGLHAALHSQWIQLCDLIGHPELVTDPRFADPLARAANVEALDGYLLPWLAQHTRQEAFRLLQEAGIPASSHPTVAEVLESPQLAARGAWREALTPSGVAFRVPGAPARLLGLGPHAATPDGAGPWRPGSIRVVDLSMGWAGPLVSHILGCFRADVIKVEGPRRFDWWRGSRPPGDDPNHLIERSHVFNSVNRGKRGVAIDLTGEKGRELLLELVASADVLIENFRAGVLDRLGFGHDILAAQNPGLVVLRQPSFGSTGPDAALRGFGNTIEGMSGLTSLMGYPDGPPMMMSNALGDPVSGLNGTVAVLAALAARRRDGRGRWIEAAQLEGFLPFVSEALLTYQRSGRLPERLGNERPAAVPSGVFACMGDDQWVAIEACDDDDWVRLGGVINEGWTTDAALSRLAGRLDHRAEIAAGIARWTALHEREAVVSLLRAAAVPVAPVHNEADLLWAEPFQSTGFFAARERAFVGVHLYPSLPVVTDGVRQQPDRPAPLLGEHNAEIMTAIGVAPDRMEGLVGSGVIGGTAL